MRITEEVREAWRELPNVECRNLYSPPNIRIIKSRKIKWERHVALIGNEKTKKEFCENTRRVKVTR